ncbi:MAG: type III-B CRISPR module-associated protein Cmr5 [Bacteroidota bacterium]
MSTNTIKSVEQKRASQAYEYAKQGQKLGASQKDGEDSNEAKEYKSYTKKLAMMIKTNGLGATIAFVKAKSSKAAYRKLYEQLSGWLIEECPVTHFLFENKDKELVEAVIHLPFHEYRTVTVETLALMAWVSRFAEGLIQGESTENN